MFCCFIIYWGWMDDTSQRMKNLGYLSFASKSSVILYIVDLFFSSLKMKNATQVSLFLNFLLSETVYTTKIVTSFLDLGVILIEVIFYFSQHAWTRKKKTLLPTGIFYLFVSKQPGNKTSQWVSVDSTLSSWDSCSDSEKQSYIFPRSMTTR